MRIGDVGSISPSGELAAFAVAVAVVVSLSIYLTSGMEEEEVAGIGSGEMALVSSWAGLDPDRDGDVEIRDGRILVSFEKGPFPLRGDIALSTEGADLLFRDGRPVEENVRYNISSQVHDIPVLIQEDENVRPGTLSVFSWRLVDEEQ